jgi:hypothetical protein
MLNHILFYKFMAIDDLTWYQAFGAIDDLIYYRSKSLEFQHYFCNSLHILIEYSTYWASLIEKLEF